MAEYYPLLAKAVGSLPNSTSDTRRIVYERARKALIGQLRTYHPPVPEEDIEHESLELDRAIERIETEIAAAPPPAVPPPPPPVAVEPPVAPPSPAPPAAPPSPTGALGPTAPRKPIAPLRPRVPKPAPGSADARQALEPPGEPKLPKPPGGEVKPPAGEGEPPAGKVKPAVEPTPPATKLKLPSAKPNAPVPAAPPPFDAPPAAGGEAPDDTILRPRLEAQRPIAPQPPVAQGPKRKVWIIPVGVAAVVALVAIAAWKLRVTPETIARNTPQAQTQPQDSGKIVDRVGGKPADDQATQPAAVPSGATTEPPAAPAQTPDTAPGQEPAQQPPQDSTKTAAPPASNPEVPVAYRAALLVEAPDLPSKVQTFSGTVVWKLINVNAGPGDAVGLSVEADVDLPDDKMKATIIFEKNSDSSLPASHTIKVRFTVMPGSYSGDIKQINVPQMRGEGSSDGEPMAGVTVPVIQNSFLVGLSPGNAETANLRVLGDSPWVDIPMLLTSGKIAKLTFEKGAAGQRDLTEALAYWAKQ